MKLPDPTSMILDSCKMTPRYFWERARCFLVCVQWIPFIPLCCLTNWCCQWFLKITEHWAHHCTPSSDLRERLPWTLCRSNPNLPLISHGTAKTKSKWKRQHWGLGHSEMDCSWYRASQSCGMWSLEPSGSDPEVPWRAASHLYLEGTALPSYIKSPDSCHTLHCLAGERNFLSPF